MAKKPADNELLVDFLSSGPYAPRKARDFDEWALKLAAHAARRSTCARRQAGAVATDANRRIISIGYNGVPQGFPHCTKAHPCPGAQGKPGDTDDCIAIHAEINCIIHAHDPFRICTMYVTASPCFKCALVLANLPALKRVVFAEEYPDLRGLTVLARAGVRLVLKPIGRVKMQKGA